MKNMSIHGRWSFPKKNLLIQLTEHLSQTILWISVAFYMDWNWLETVYIGTVSPLAQDRGNTLPIYTVSWASITNYFIDFSGMYGFSCSRGNPCVARPVYNYVVSKYFQNKYNYYTVKLVKYYVVEGQFSQIILFWRFLCCISSSIYL